jgi:hypothetical protein
MKEIYESSLFFESSSRASFAYSRYWLHKYQMTIQFERIQIALQERILAGEWLKEPDISQSDAARLWFHFGGFINKKILAEAHLYFIAIDNVKDMINIILSEHKFPHLKKEFGNLNKIFEHFTHGRNTFEHFDDRIPGGKKHEKVAEKKSSPEAGAKRTLGGVINNTYVFGDKEWSLSESQFQEIANGINTFEQSVHGILDKTA